MTTLAHDSARRGPSNGGVAARRAVVRWAWRMFRREWRQQILVVALLTVAVAAAIGSITLVYNTSPAFDGEFGSANGLLLFDGSDPQALEAALASAEESFGTTDVIGHRKVPVPGGVETVDFRSQDPDGPYGGDLLALRSGSYPAGPGQVALTEGVAELLNVELGAKLDHDGRRRTVVGIVENPLDLSDEFALVSPSSAGSSQNVTVLVDASRQELRAFADSLPENGRSGLTGTGIRGEIEAADSFALFSVATVFLLLASLVAAAGFAVVAQRRLRQLGMLAAIGATQKHLRLVLLTNGAVVGVIAAILGTIAGGALWVIFALDSRIRDGPSHRPAQPPVDAARAGRPPRHPQRYRSRLVARANGRPPSHPARAFRASASAEARTPLGDRGRGADHGRYRLSRTVRPRPSAAHRRRDRGDDPRHLAPGPARDPHLLRSRRTRPDRHSPGVA